MGRGELEFVKVWFSRFEIKVPMIYLLLIVLLVQSIFWWLFRLPTMSFDWIFQLKFFNLFIAAFLIWIISGKSK